MNRQAQGVVLLLLGAAALRASLTDLHLRYVKESLQPFLVAASVVLMVAGAITLWYEWRPRWAGAEPAGPEPGHEAGHGHSSRVGWLLVAPVLGLLLVAPPALGAYTATNAGTSLSAPPEAVLPALPPYLDPVPLTVLDYAARAIWEDGASLAGRRVSLTGFLITDSSGQPYLARLSLSCCAADARPIKLGLAGAAAGDLAGLTRATAGDSPAGGETTTEIWVEVVGTYTDQTGVDPVNQATIAFLAVETWRQVPAPRQPYE